MNEEEAPRRVHPATILAGWVRRGPSTVIGLVAFAAFAARNGGGMWLIGVGAVVLAMLAFKWLDWWAFTYRIGADELVIERGVLRRSRRSIPLERIQDVSIEQKPLARLLGIALVRIETGGGEKDEGSLDSVSLAEAHRLRAILRGKARVAHASGDAATAEEADTLVFEMGLGRVLLQGLFRFSLLWVAVILGLLDQVDQFLGFSWVDMADLARREAKARLTAELALSLTLTVAVAAIVLGVVSGVLRTVARDYGFRLTHGEGRFRRVRGLLTRSEVVIADRRIQLALVRRAMVSGRLGWNALDFQTLGGSDDPSGRQEAAPFATAEETARVIEAAALPRFERDALEPVARGHVLRAAIRHATPVLLVAGAATLAAPWLWWLLLAVPVPVGVALLQRRHHRYALRDTSLQIMRGVLAQRDWIVPYGSVQGVVVRRTWLQRRLGVATVDVDTAGARGLHPAVADIRQDKAESLAVALLARA